MTYSDLNKDNPDVSSLVTDIPDIQQSIDMILLTRRGERLFNIPFGASFADNLFDLIDDVTAARIRNILSYSLSVWDPRIRVIQSMLKVTPYPDDVRYDIEVGYQIAGIGDETFQYVGSIQMER